MSRRLAANADPTRRLCEPLSNQSARMAGTTDENPRTAEIPMEQTTVNGVDLAYDVEGEGAPLLFIHGAIWADFLRPLATLPSLSWGRRSGFHPCRIGHSGRPAGGC